METLLFNGKKKKKSKDNSFALEQGRISNKQFKLKIFR